MSKIRRLTALLMLLCVESAALLGAFCMDCAAAGREDLISADAISPETANYRTMAVERGDYSVSAQGPASILYPVTYSVRYEGIPARFAEFTVSKGDYVQQGDVLAVLNPDVSRASVSAQELALQRTREAYAEGKRTRQQALSGQEQSDTGEQTALETERQRLEREKLQLELERYCYEQEHSIAQQQQEIDAFYAEYEDTCVRAPASGRITSLEVIREDEPVSSGRVMLEMHSEEKMLICVQNPNGDFRYNMPVTVESGVKKNVVTLPGRVVATDALLSETKRDYNAAFIRLDEPREEELYDCKVRCETIHIPDVLLVSRSALMLDGGNYYVNKLADGTVKKRFVNPQLLGPKQTWVVQGLEEGDLVIPG